MKDIVRQLRNNELGMEAAETIRDLEKENQYLNGRVSDLIDEILVLKNKIKVIRSDAGLPIENLLSSPKKKNIELS